MARKTAQSVVEPPELQERVKRPRRHKNLLQPLSGEAPSADVITLMTDTIVANSDALGWQGTSKVIQMNADEWARIILRAVRYGVEHEGEGFSILDQEQPIPMCDDCG